MKVYVWFEVIEYDYEGSENSNMGVFSSREAVIREIKKCLPEADEFFNGDEWHLPRDHKDRRGDQHYWTIEEWSVAD
jgi:hypothetical protein